ncbi:Uncharacterised protein [Mycobacteroides abscessus subsp. abscessus]|nr:Uncharacterised protein [Mycobacteroides abscessus subsp. abscessus]
MSRPLSRCGSSFSHSARRSSAVIDGPTLHATGLAIRENNSTCGPSRCRVRSPIQGQCVEVSTMRFSPSRRN